MATLSKLIAEDQRAGLANEVNGLPTLDLMDMQGAQVPVDYEIESVLGDILMCEVADETEIGEVTRGGIIISQEMATKMWRVAKVLKVGPQSSGNVKPGDYVMYPSDKGIPLINHNRQKLLFLNEARIFCVCTPIKK